LQLHKDERIQRRFEPIVTDTHAPAFRLESVRMDVTSTIVQQRNTIVLRSVHQA
jgi:hypothetical protein